MPYEVYLLLEEDYDPVSGQIWSWALAPVSNEFGLIQGRRHYFAVGNARAAGERFCGSHRFLIKKTIQGSVNTYKYR